MTTPSPRQRWLWRLLVLEALLVLTVVTLALRLLPFRHAARLLFGEPVPPAISIAAAESIAEPDAVSAWRVGQAVTRAVGLLPFPALCLPQAVAAKRMLARRGQASSLHLSARLGGETEAVAHAWLTWQGRPVIGGGLPRGQTEVARFV